MSFLDTSEHKTRQKMVAVHGPKLLLNRGLRLFCAIFTPVLNSTAQAIDFVL